LLLGVLQQPKKAIRKSLSITGRIELYSEFLAQCHLPEVWQIGTDDWHTKGACQMRNATAAS